MLAALVLSAAAPLSAQAQDTLPDDSGVSQYLESVPSGAGPTSPDSSRATRLPPRAAHAVRRSGSADAGALRRIAGSSGPTPPEQGAPRRGSGSVGALAPGGGTTGTPGRSTASAAVSSLGSGGWLVVVALVVLTGAGGTALVRRRT